MSGLNFILARHGFAPYQAGLITVSGVGFKFGKSSVSAEFLRLDKIKRGVPGSVALERLRTMAYNPKVNPHDQWLSRSILRFADRARRILTDPRMLKEILQPNHEEIEQQFRLGAMIVTHPRWESLMTELWHPPDGSGALIREITGDHDLIQKIKAWNRFFGIPKDEEIARAILNAKVTNGAFLTPWPINLAEPPKAIRFVQRELGPKRSARIKEGKGGKIWVVSMDWRHYFHQLSCGTHLQAYFGLRFRKGGRMLSGVWANVPMGWSWAPHIAQCLGWQFVCYKNEMLDVDWKLDAPPQYIMTKSGEGIVFLYIDNVHAYFLSSEQAEEFVKSVARNMEYYRVHLKYAVIDGEHYRWDSVLEGEKAEVTYDNIQITLDRRRNEKGALLMRVTPTALGMEFENEAGDFVIRVCKDKIDQLPRTLVRTEIQSPEDHASILGKIFYRRLLLPRLRPGAGALIAILSKIGKHASGHGWKDRGFHRQITSKEWEVVVKEYKWLTDNVWIHADMESHERPVALGASDASTPGWGGVFYGFFSKAELPGMRNQCPVKVKDLLVLEHGTWFEKYPGGELNRLWYKRHIYLKELYAAVELVKRIVESRDEVDIVLGVDNSGTRAALNRGVSVNEIGGEMLEDLMKLLEEKNSTLMAVPIPGYFNVADWPSRGKGVPLGQVTRKSPKKEFKDTIHPVKDSWRIIVEGYMGLIRSYKPEEFTRKDEGRRHDEPELRGPEEEELAEMKGWEEETPEPPLSAEEQEAEAEAIQRFLEELEKQQRRRDEPPTKKPRRESE
tara:strand:+ start:846 stop:3206 length:2361 start_codon:yes stop_codon:yes gene_type:complete